MTASAWQLDLGAQVLEGGGTRFRVWAPKAKSMAVLVLSGKAAGTVAMQREDRGYFSVTVPGVADGDRYLYRPDDRPARPDPAARFQPEGVHGASQVVDPRLFDWRDAGWSGLKLEEYRIYELHLGTFSREGTCEGAIPHLDYLRELGITAVEIMPVSQFPGERNWGYDGVYHFAPQNSYGGPDGLKRLVDACHRRGLAVILDVVYNHFGPEGSYHDEFGDYFTDKYRTPWGRGLNFDGANSDQVVEFFQENALYWINEFHMDALRLDAVDWIFDQTPQHFLQRLACAVRLQGERLGRRIQLFAENDTNDPRLINPAEKGGHGIDAQWCDNFHHALRTILTGETSGYYEDFGQFGQLVKAYAEGFVYTGEYSHYRLRRHGAPAMDRPTCQFVVFSQNHDQVGNRRCGDRLSASEPLEKLLLAAGVVLLSPYLPLLFMGEEYGERAPFHYFVDHSDPELIAAVLKGKLEEHASGICEGEIPDPGAESTFLESKIDLTVRREGEQALILSFYRQLLALRANLPPLKVCRRSEMEVTGLVPQKTLTIRRWAGKDAVLCLFSFSNVRETVTLPLPAGRWERILDSSQTCWRGAGEVAAPEIVATGADCPITINPFSVLVYHANNKGE